MHSAAPPGGTPPDDGEDIPYPKPPQRDNKRKRVEGDINDTNTDAANGGHFAFMHGGHLRYVADVQKWIIWDARRWTYAVEGDLLRAAKQTAESLLVHAVRLKGEQERASAFRWAITSANRNRLKAMIELASSESDVELRVHELDADPFLLNVSNGTVNLRLGSMREHHRSDFITKCVPIAYDPEAACPRWLQFLEEVFGADEELISFVQRAIGYSLTGDTREHALFLLWGNGCNGKSVFIEVLRALLGDLATATPMSTFTTKRDSSAPTNDLAMLRGARLVTVQESDEGSRFSESTVKQLTGGDAITARFLNKEFFTFMPAFKPWLATNYKPKVKGTDDGFWRRVRLIPFTVSFLGREDKSLLTALMAELPGILNWAVDGCISWQLHGLGTAGAVADATREYREESDSIAEFIRDCCVLHADASISSARLYAIYTEWAEEHGERPMKQRTLIQAVLSRDGVSAHRSKFERGLSGIGELRDSVTQ